MESGFENLSGMDPSAAREYIAAHIGTLKLTEKKHGELGKEREKWEGRISLARSRGMTELAEEAEREAAKAGAGERALAGEIADLKSRIEGMKNQLPGLAARERSIDPDMLEQELLIARGLNPGDEESRKTESAFEELEKDAAAEAALKALKLKMGQNNGGGG